MPTNSTSEIRNALATATLDLNKARDDAALFERLQRAAGEAKRLQALCTKLTTDLAAGEDREAKEAKAALARMFRKLEIIVGRPADRNLSALSARYTIQYEQLAWDGDARESVWQTRRIEGLSAVPDDVWDYLFAHCPGSLPSLITDLAPGDPYQALERYFLALRRGFIEAN